MGIISPDRHEGHKVQLWVPDDLYAALKARAARRDTSVAEELRRAASAGLDPLQGLDEIRALLIDLRQFERLHMEPLAFLAAMDAGKSAAYWHAQVLVNSTERAGGNEQEGRAVADMADRAMADRATKRIQRKLQLGGDEEPLKGEEANGPDDGA